MTLQIPEEFPDWLVTCVAGHFPVGDEDAARRLGDQWSETAENCRALAERHDVAASSERAAIAGTTSDAKTDRNLQLGDDLRNQAAYADSMAEQCYKGANDIEFNKLLVIGTGFALLAQLALDAALMAPGVIKAAQDRAAAEASWAAAGRQRLLSIKGVGAQCAVQRAGIPLAKATAIGAAIGAGTGALVHGGAQWWQKEVLHHRDKIEWDDVRDAAIIGGAGGALGARFASRFAPGINRVIGKATERSQSNLVRYGAHITSGVLIGGVGGVAGTVGGVVAQIPLTGHIPNGQELQTALITGFVGGFVGSATIFAQPLPPRPVTTRPEPANRSGSQPTPDPSPPPSGGNDPAPRAASDENPPAPTAPPGGNPPPPDTHVRPPDTPVRPPETPTRPPETPVRPPDTPERPTPKPNEPEPTTPKPNEPEPTTPKPNEPEPTTPKPNEPEPTTPKPNEPEPTTPKPNEPEPTTPKPNEPEPTTPKPNEPEPTTPKPNEPEPTTPKPNEPEPTTPKPNEPEPTTPKPNEPEPTTPKPNEPEPTTPKPNEPEPTTPKPNEPEPTTPKPNEPEPTTPKLDEKTPPPQHPDSDGDPADPSRSPRTEEETSPSGEQRGVSPFAWHPDAAALDRAVAEFPSVFDQPRTLAELRAGLSHDMSFDDLMAVRDFSYQQHGLEAPDLSVENLNGFLQNIWDNADMMTNQNEVYRAYGAATEPNTISNPQAYMRQLADILASRAPEMQMAYIQGIRFGDSPLMLAPNNADRVEPKFVHFVHFGRENPDPNVGYRVYVNARAAAVPDLMRGVVHEIVDRPDRFPGIYSAKVVGARSVRSDAMVIYTNDLADAHRVVDWLREYQTREPDAFLWTAPAMTQQVMEGVGIGAEPVRENSSFGSVRAEAIHDALQSTRSENGDFAMFRERVLARLADLSIDPDHPHLNQSR